MAGLKKLASTSSGSEVSQAIALEAKRLWRRFLEYMVGSATVAGDAKLIDTWNQVVSESKVDIKSTQREVSLALKLCLMRLIASHLDGLVY